MIDEVTTLDILESVKAVKKKDAFQKFCRAEGSRCNLIMTWIEQGLSNEEIAQRINASKRLRGTMYMKESPTSTLDVEMYRRVLNGTIDEGFVYDENKKPITEKTARMVCMAQRCKRDGMRQRDIAREVKCSQGNLKHLFVKFEMREGYVVKNDKNPMNVTSLEDWATANRFKDLFD